MANSKRKCKHCKEYFNDWVKLPAGTFCTIQHATEWASGKAKEKQAKAKRAKHRADKERLKTKSDHAKEAQAAFNAWVRERDKDLPCISCQRHHAGQYHAGHYRSVGACPELRFEPLNNNKQCAPCNTHLSGNAIEYRINLVKKIGVEKVEWLEGKHEPRRYDIEDLKQIKAHYRKKLRALKEKV